MYKTVKTYNISVSTNQKFVLKLEFPQSIA